MATHVNVNAYGFLEVRGLVAGIEAADAMVKSAHVRLAAQLLTNPALVTLVVEGDIGACAAALDAGRIAALRVGQVVSERLIGRPEADIELFFGPPVRPAVPIAAAAPLVAAKARAPRHNRKKRT